VDERFAWLSSRGGVPIAPPVETDWGHYTGFFADPEGNIHSLVAVPVSIRAANCNHSLPCPTQLTGGLS